MKICEQITKFCYTFVNPLNAELNPNCHLLELLGAHHILHVSKIMVKIGYKQQGISHEDL